MLGPKNLAIALYAITDGDRDEAEKIWDALADTNPANWQEAWDASPHTSTRSNPIA